jgi:hypothetical protein
MSPLNNSYDSFWMVSFVTDTWLIGMRTIQKFWTGESWEFPRDSSDDVLPSRWIGRSGLIGSAAGRMQMCPQGGRTPGSPSPGYSGSSSSTG